MDKLIINPRERPYSPDIMDLQAMASRAFADFMRYSHSTAFSAGSALSSASACYGLAMTATAGTQTYVTLSPGVLMQLSTTLSPVPGTLDSPYRVGIARSTANITLPTPGSATWYLLEAQMADSSTLTDTRDIMNALTGLFQSTLVTKRSETGVVTQWVAGTASQIPSPSFGNWVTIGAVLVQVGGTVLDSADAVDLRPLAKLRTVLTRQGWSRKATVPVLRTDAAPAAAVSRIIRLAVDNATTNQDGSGYGGGIDLSISDANSLINPIDPSTASVLDPTTTLAASTWYYLYLCPWYDSAPFSSRQGASYARGVLVLSATPPDAEGLFNGASVTLPAPFGNYAVPAFQAPCVGALRSNAANTGWVPMTGGNGEFVLKPDIKAFLAGGTQAISAALIPAHAKLLRWAAGISFTGTPDATAAIHLQLGDVGGTAVDVGWAGHNWRLVGNVECDRIRLSVPRRVAKEVYTAVVNGAGPTIGTVTLELIGYTV